jgi:hypothetical protein
MKRISSKFISSDLGDKLDIPRLERDDYKLEITCFFCNDVLDLRKSGPSASSQEIKKREKGGGSNKEGKSVDAFLRCYTCKKHGLYCSICCLPVRTVSAACVRCGHGGHFDHLLKWFQKFQECPTVGCGCKCRSSVDVRNDEMIQFRDQDEDDDDDDDEEDDGYPLPHISSTAVHSNNASNLNNMNALFAKDNSYQPSGRKSVYYESKGSQPDYIAEILNPESEYNYNNFDG